MPVGKRAISVVVLAVGIWLVAAASSAQVDLSGAWGQRVHEDALERRPNPESGLALTDTEGGAEIGDYLAMPINDAARMKADTWDASRWTVPEHQCEPHPMDYNPRGPSSLRMWPEVDRQSQEIVAWRVTVSWMLPERTIWMDGRPHPPDYARHTWQGFSTGTWDGDMLVVTTTHLKTAWLARNGLARSDQGVVTEYWLRHDNVLTLVTAVDDPIYLTEPLVRTSNWVLDLGYTNGPYTCDTRIEVPRPKGAVPYHLPGANTFLGDVAVKFGLPVEATRGGAETAYPEYLDTMKTMKIPPARRADK